MPDTGAQGGPILITGATGLVGGRLLRELVREGAAVRTVSRHPERAGRRLPPGAAVFGWDGVHPPAEALIGAEAVVHLSGEPIFSGPLTQKRRRSIRDSRVDSTRAIASALGRVGPAERPRTFLCGSAVGYYGSRGEEVLDEGSPPGEGFLADVCRDWEAAAQRAEEHGVRTTALRTGIVLAREGGALPIMAMPFRLGLGGQLGDGRQWVPWIHADDWVALARAALSRDTESGPVNAVAPEPARNRELTRALGRVLGRPTFMRVPAFALRAALGELADELLGSRHVVSKRHEALGVRFRHADLESALRAEL